MPNRDYYFPPRQLVAQNDAALIQNPTVPRSRFLGAWTHKTAIHSSYLYPIMVDELLPGDHVRYNLNFYVRMQTLLFPMLDQQRVDTFFFFVPMRLTWTNFKKFMGEQNNPADSTAYTIPIINSPVGGFGANTLYDHFGVPTAGQTDAAQTIAINALPVRAYGLIWNQWFRDENIQNSMAIASNGDDGPDPYTDYNTQRRGKSHDYFTSALPWAQKFTAPSIPLDGLAKVQGIGVDNLAAGGGPSTLYDTAGGGVARAVADYVTPGVGPNIRMQTDGVTFIPHVYADLSTVTGIAINQFRNAIMVQTMLERDARGGTRYNEKVEAHFGVRNPDARLQRPEYIGGGQTPLNVTPVAQTAPSGATVVGGLGGTGTSVGQHTASYAATEHGYVIAIANIRSELSYQQGLHKLWQRRTQYDFYWPSLAGLGEQAVLRSEIYSTGVANDDNTVFGYQERWQEYRTNYSIVTGMMRSYYAGTLDNWHLAQRFTAAPTLSATFITENAPVERVIAAGVAAAEQQYLCDFLFQRDITRPIPTYGTPATLGRF